MGSCVSGVGWSSATKHWRSKDKIRYSKSAADKALELEVRKSQLLNSDAFQELSEGRVQDLLNLMEEADFHEGEFLCKIKDASECFWYIRKGAIDVISGEGKKLAVLPKGTLTGEIGMIKNVPRTATLRVNKASVIMRINRADYNAILEKQASLMKTAAYAALMRTGLFQGWTSRLTMTMLEVMKPKVFKDGEIIMKKGDPPDFMYVIEEGGVLVHIDRKPPAEWVSLKVGQYFGEKALLNDGVRGATVSGGPSGCKCLAMDKKSFQRFFMRTKAKFEMNIMINEHNMKKNSPTANLLQMHEHRRDFSRVNNVRDAHPARENQLTELDSPAPVDLSNEEEGTEGAAGENEGALTIKILNPVNWFGWVPGLGGSAGAEVEVPEKH